MTSVDKVKALESFKILLRDNIIVFETLNRVENDEQTIYQAELVESELFSIFKKYPSKKFSLLVNLYKGNHTTSMPDKALSIYKSLASHDQLEKIVIVGGNGIIRAVVRFIITIAGKAHRFRWFSTRKDAENWLGLNDNKKTKTKKSSKSLYFFA